MSYDRPHFSKKKQMHMRSFFPYVIRAYEDGSYYVLNRYYEYIGLGVKHVPHTMKQTDHYTFNDGCPPFYSKTNFKLAKKKFYDLIADNNFNVCLNPINIEEIFNLV